MSEEYLDMSVENARIKAEKEAALLAKSQEPTEQEKIQSALSSATEEVQSEEVESDPTQTESEEETEDALLASDEDTELTESEPVTHRSKAAEKRIAKLVKEREQLKGQLALYQQHQSQETTQEHIEVSDPTLPDPANYKDGENDIDYRLDVREHQRAAIKRDQEFNENLKQAFIKYPDLPSLIEADESKTNATMVQLIKESNIGSELFAYLMKNPDVSNKIAAMSPAQSAKEMGKIEMKLEEKVAVTKTTAPVKKPLPPPITPVKSSKAAATTAIKQSKYTQY